MKNVYMFGSSCEDQSDEGFFCGYNIEADSEAEAWREIKLLLTKKEFETCELI